MQSVTLDNGYTLKWFSGNTLAEAGVSTTTKKKQSNQRHESVALKYVDNSMRPKLQYLRHSNPSSSIRREEGRLVKFFYF